MTQSTLTLETLKQELVNDTKIKVAAVDIDGLLRGKVMDKDKFLSIAKDGFGFCSILFGWDILDKPYDDDSEFSGEDSTFSDLNARVDLASFRRIPWEDNIPFFLVYLHNPHTEKALHCCPRSLLKNTTDDFAKLGLNAYCGIEFEFYCFKETSESLSEKDYSALKPLTLGMCGYSMLRPLQNQEFYYNAFDWLKKFNVDVESWHTETGTGVFEAAIGYKEAKEAGDRAALFKTSMKQIGLKHNIMTSFMAKPYQGQPGCSGHVHFTLMNKNGENVFSVGEPSQYPHMTKTMVHFLAGVMKALPSVLPIYAPTINSYKRLKANGWAPVSVSWGIDSRNCAVRVIAPPSCPPKSTRMELRVSGADINAHLVLATVLKCGYWGIQTKQELTIQPCRTVKDLLKDEQLPTNLKDAVANMGQKGSVAREVLGNDFVDHFVRTRNHEWSLWEKAVTDYELKRYMELV
ncbi:hypothetical protein BDB01DRAFT_832098 [Pilobolus umbonatus]|nr:hypothetical protein BDB01DRAFT_832098 [Pilobolus umbonatus]